MYFGCDRYLWVFFSSLFCMLSPKGDYSIPLFIYHLLLQSFSIKLKKFLLATCIQSNSFCSQLSSWYIEYQLIIGWYPVTVHWQKPFKEVGHRTMALTIMYQDIYTIMPRYFSEIGLQVKWELTRELIHFINKVCNFFGCGLLYVLTGSDHVCFTVKV